MNTTMKKLVPAVLGALVLIGLVVLVIKLIGGAVGLVGGLLNAVLGVVVVLALVAIVVWMFSYASKNR